MDTNVLINILHVSGLDLCARLPGFEFAVPEDVLAEITNDAQRATVAKALRRSVVRPITLNFVETLALFAELRRSMGRGEAACLALAARHGWWVASDEKGRFRRTADALMGPGRILTTPGLLLLAIRARILTVHDADAAKQALEQRRFKMRFSSFSELESMLVPWTPHADQLSQLSAVG